MLNLHVLPSDLEQVLISITKVVLGTVIALPQVRTASRVRSLLLTDRFALYRIHVSQVHPLAGVVPPWV